MKMETEIAAGVDGEVEEITVAAGDQVSRGQPLIKVTPGHSRYTEK
jgi:biotin carboxyl carrier protein